MITSPTSLKAWSAVAASGWCMIEIPDEALPQSWWRLAAFKETEPEGVKW
jgi:flavin reductase (DIM6/NTAB) family NADH-FMN oxidoreductase RutF